MRAEEIVRYLNRSNFEVFVDHWNEQHLYFGKHGNQLMDVDKLFGSDKFKLPADQSMLERAAQQVLLHPIDPSLFSQKDFLRQHTDIIAIERSLANRLKRKFLSIDAT